MVWEDVIRKDTLAGEVLGKPLLPRGMPGELCRAALLSKPGGGTGAFGLSALWDSKPGGAGPEGLGWRIATCTFTPGNISRKARAVPTCYGPEQRPLS